ncbi:MAG: hypothetical protein PHQ23_13660 [Candidatus Wallbacteria bacterium]|nr:hypothetical protein [Candidatus Wallbacteria bacterium]
MKRIVLLVACLLIVSFGYAGAVDSVKPNGSGTTRQMYIPPEGLGGG